MDRAQRDLEICKMYLDGVKLKDIAKKFNLSRAWVSVIVHEQNNISRDDRCVEDSERDEFLGVNLSDDEKAGLREEAKRRGISMSALTADLIKDMLATVSKQPEATT